MTRAGLNPKQEAFCRLMASGKCKDQSDAYRKAYKPKTATPPTIHVKASHIMALDKVRTRIKELSEPIVLKVRKTREDLLDLYQAGGWFDPRKMFDTHGNPLEIPSLPDQEAMMLDGFEIVEEFSGKGEERVHVGYTRKFKLGDRHKYATSYGKMMGFITDEQEDTAEKAARSIHVTFVSAKGEQVQVNVANGQDGQHEQNGTPSGLPRLGVTFVK